jgi:hypothetical protein
LARLPACCPCLLVARGRHWQRHMGSLASLDLWRAIRSRLFPPRRMMDRRRHRLVTLIVAGLCLSVCLRPASGGLCDSLSLPRTPHPPLHRGVWRPHLGPDVVRSSLRHDVCMPCTCCAASRLDMNSVLPCTVWARTVSVSIANAALPGPSPFAIFRFCSLLYIVHCCPFWTSLRIPPPARRLP